MHSSAWFSYMKLHSVNSMMLLSDKLPSVMTLSFNLVKGHAAPISGVLLTLQQCRRLKECWIHHLHSACNQITQSSSSTA